MDAAGAWSWAHVVPIASVAALVLLVPGFVCARLLRLPASLSVGLAPALSTGVLGAGGIVAGALGIRWGLAALLVSLAVAAGLSAGVGALLALRSPSDPPTGTSPDAARPGPWAAAPTLLLGAAGVAVALGVVWTVLLAVAPEPTTFPQHPDINLHLALPRWMADHGDISYFHALTLVSDGTAGGYPIGWHALVTTVMLLTGAPVTVASHACVVAVAGLAWPLGMIALARATLGRGAAVAPAAAVTSVLFTAYPFMVVSYGVLYPNFFGQGATPGVLAASVALVDRWAGRPLTACRPGPLVVAVLAAVPGLALAHPNAVITWAVLTALVVWTATVRRAVRPGSHVDGRRWAPLGLTAAATVLAGALLTAVRPSDMVRAGARGPGLTPQVALWDTLLFAPRDAGNLTLLAVTGLGGVLMVAVRPRAWWVAVATGALMLLFYADVAVDSDLSRLFTWPWYNNAVRIAAVGVLPAALLVAAALVGAGRLAAGLHPRTLQRPVLAGAVTVALTSGLLIATDAYRGVKVDWMRQYYQPGRLRSWVTPAEQASLQELARHLAPDSVTAQNPWNGGQYLYQLDGRSVLFATEKMLNTPDRILLGSALDRIGEDPAVCAAARRAGVSFALTGGDPFVWATPADLAAYRGIDGVGRSPAWQKVATAAPYTLYRMVRCAS